MDVCKLLNFATVLFSEDPVQNNFQSKVTFP